MFPISATGPRRRRLLAAALLVLLAALLAGCGGGDSSSDTSTGTSSGVSTDSSGEDGGDQEAMRAEMLAAADRFDDVRALDASISIEASEAESSETVHFCFSLAVVNGKGGEAEEKVALRTYTGECAGKPASEVVILGRDVWASQFGGKWSAGRVDPEMVEELTSEDDKYDELLEAATDIRPGPEPNSYEFSAPASAFSQIEEIGDVEVDFVLTIDQQGYLSGMVGTVEEEGSKAVIEQTYEVGDIGPIEAPPAADVVGPVRDITSKAALDALLEPSFEEGFE